MDHRSLVSWEEDGMRVCVEGHDVVPESLDVFLASVYGDVSMDSYQCFYDFDAYVQRLRQRSAITTTSQGNNNNADAYDAFMILCENISPKCSSTFKAMREVCREANSKLKKRITAVRGFFVEPFFTFVHSLPTANSVFFHALDDANSRESVLIDNCKWWRAYCDTSSRAFETFLLSAHQMTEVHFVGTNFPDQLIPSLVNSLERSAVKRVVFDDKDMDMIRAPSPWFEPLDERSPTWSGENIDETLVVYKAAQRWSLCGITAEVEDVFAMWPSLVHPHMAEVELRRHGSQLIQLSEIERTPWHRQFCNRLDELAKSDTLMLRIITLDTEARDDECMEIVTALSACSCLQSIDLSRNYAGLKTARALAQLSTVCPHVKYLGLTDAFAAYHGACDILSSVFSVPWPALRVLTYDTTEDSIDFLMNNDNVPSRLCIVLSASLDERRPTLSGVREAFSHRNKRFFIPFHFLPDADVE